MKYIFAKAIRRARVRGGLTQEQLAAKLGIGQARVAQIESSGNALSEDLFLRCAAALGMTPQALLGLVEEE
jgi:transcriptional regulator with XRE-family HTH domain